MVSCGRFYIEFPLIRPGSHKWGIKRMIMIIYSYVICEFNYFYNMVCPIKNLSIYLTPSRAMKLASSMSALIRCLEGICCIDPSMRMTRTSRFSFPMHEPYLECGFSSDLFTWNNTTIIVNNGMKKIFFMFIQTQM
jgi:hypothetical protein